MTNCFNPKVIFEDEKGFSREMSVEEYNEYKNREQKRSNIDDLNSHINDLLKDTQKQEKFTRILANIGDVFKKIKANNPLLLKLVEDNFDLKEKINVYRDTSEQMINNTLKRTYFIFQNIQVFSLVGQYSTQRITEILKAVEEGQIEEQIAFEEIMDIYDYYGRLSSLSNQFRKELIKIGLSNTEPIFNEFHNIDKHQAFLNEKVLEFNTKYFANDLSKIANQRDWLNTFNEQIASYEKQREMALAKNRLKEVASLDKRIEKLYQKMPSKENYLAHLEGRGIDMNKWDFMFNALIRTSDPIVAAVRIKINNAIAKITNRIMNMATIFSKAHTQFLSKTGRTRTNLKESNKDIYVIETIYTYNKETKKIEQKEIPYFNQWFSETLISESLAKWQQELDKYESNSKEFKDKFHEFEKWQIEHFQQPYLDIVYSSEDLLSFEAKQALSEAEQEYYEAKNTNDSNFSIENASAEFNALHNLRNLRRDYDRNGILKSEEQLKIAREIDAYKKLRKSFYVDFSNEEEIASELLQQRKLDAQKRYENNYLRMQALMQQRIENGESEDKINNTFKTWKKRNQRINISKEFYSKREEITKQLREIDLEFSDAGEKETQMDIWKKIFNVVGKYRDENNRQIQAEYMTDGEVNLVKQWLADIELLKEVSFGKKGFTLSEKERFNDLLNKYDIEKYNKQTHRTFNNFLKLVELTVGEKGTVEEHQDILNYIAKNQELLTQRANERFVLTEEEENYYKALRAKRKQLYRELETLQTKQTTTNYDETYERKLDEFIIRQKLLMNDKSIVTPESKEEYDREFRNETNGWYKANHIEVIKYSDEGPYRTMEPIYIWVETVPNNSEYIEILPAYHYYESVVKEEFHNKEYEQHPLGSKFSVPKHGGIFDKKDAIFEKPNSVKDALDFLTKHYVEAQQNLPMHLRSMRIPSFEKTFLDRIIEMGSTPSAWATYFKRMFTTTELDTDEGIGLKDLSEDKKFSVVPILHHGIMDIDNFSFDIWGNTLKFIHHAYQREYFAKELPYLQGLVNVLHQSENNIELDIEQKKLLSIFNTSKGVANNKNITADAIISTIRTVLFNEYRNSSEAGILNFQKIVGTANKAASIAMLTWNIPSAIVNQFSGKVQTWIETFAKDFITSKEYSKGQLEYTKNASIYLNDATNLDIGKVSFKTQMLFRWQVLPNALEEQLGEGFGKNFTKNALSTTFFGSYIRHSTEHNLYTSIWLAKLKREQVMVNNKQMSLLDLYEMLAKNHNIYRMDELNDNPDIKNKYEIRKLSTVKDQLGDLWKQNDEDVLREQVKGVNADLFGEYAKIEKSVFAKTWYGTAVEFFRKYVVRMATHRLAGAHLPRYNMTTNRLREGFYVTMWRLLINPLFRQQYDRVYATIQEAIKGNRDLSPQEVANVRRGFAELGFILVLGIFIATIGDDDEEMDEHSFLTLYSLYFMKRVKSETEQFIFLPFVGDNEIWRAIAQPSLAFERLKRYTRLLTDLKYIVTGDERQYLRQDAGYWEKGDSKLLKDMLAVVGLTGNTFYPREAIKSFTYGQNPR